jgi:hypothetical protein
MNLKIVASEILLIKKIIFASCKNKKCMVTSIKIYTGICKCSLFHTLCHLPNQSNGTLGDMTIATYMQ